MPSGPAVRLSAFWGDPMGGGALSRRTVLGVMASIVPAAHASTPISLRTEEDGIVLRSGSDILWTVRKSEIAAALGPTAKAEETSENNKVRVARGSLLGALDCVLEATASASGDLTLAVKIGRSPIIQTETVALGQLQKTPSAWLSQKRVSFSAIAPIRTVLREDQLVLSPSVAIGIDEKLRIHLIDEAAGMSYWPRPGRFKRLQLLARQDEEAAAVTWPLAIASQPIGETLRFDGGSREESRLDVSIPTAMGETTIFAHRSKTYRFVSWRAGPDAKAWEFRIDLRHPSDARHKENSRFPGAPGTEITWSHSDREDETRGMVLTRLDWNLPDEPFAFEGRQGRFSLRGEERYDRYTPASIVSESANNRLLSFRATAYLTNFAVSLPNSDYGRLDFDRETCSFPLAGLGDVDDGSYVQLGSVWGKDKHALSLKLNMARLRVLRARDHLSLDCRFRNVTLERAGGTMVLQRHTSDAALIAELPPQHIAERAFARVLPDLPAPRSDLSEEQARSVRSATVEDRRKLQAELSKRPSNAAFKDFAERFWKAIDSGKIEVPAAAGVAGAKSTALELAFPKEAAKDPDAIWLGPQHVRTVWARRAARELALIMATTSGPATLPALDTAPNLYGDWTAAWDTLQRTRKQVPANEGSEKFASAAVSNIIDSATRISDEQRILQDVYRAWKREPPQKDNLQAYYLDKRGRAELMAWLKPRDNLPAWFTELERAAIVGDEEKDAVTGLKVKDVIADRYAKEQFRQDNETLPVDLPVYARLSGMSRLVFDFPGHPIAFDAGAISNWDGLSLRVANRARSFPAVTGVEGTEEKPLRILGDALAARGISRGSDTAQRLRDIVEATQARPGELETAIELPYRLLLSPAETARFVTVGEARSIRPADPHPLWQAKLKEEKSSTLRAIWSPDFWARHAFPANGDNPKVKPIEPPRGPWAPWQLRPGEDPSDRFRGSLDAFDRHQLVGLTGVFGMPVIPRRGPDDRTLHMTQLAPPPGFKLERNILDEQGGENPISDLNDQALYHPQALTGPTLDALKGPTLPTLALSAAGGFLSIDTTFTPPASLRWRNSRNLFNAFSVGRWQQQIVQGGDVSAQVEYVGFLMPTGHQATLVKVTERINLLPASGVLPTSYLVQRHFIRVVPEKNYNVAEAPGMPFECRGWPATKITMRGLKTPDLVDPAYDRPVRGSQGTVHPGGRIDLPNSTGLVFWPRTGRNADKNVQFTFSVDDDKDVVSMPMIFVDNQAAHDPDTMKALFAYYNGPPASASTASGTPSSPKPLSADRGLRTLQHFGALRRYAPPRTAGDTTLETVEWLVGIDSRRRDPEGYGLFAPENQIAAADFRMSSTLESRDQPPFYPRLKQATVRLQTVSGLSQTPQADSKFRYYPDYLERGFTALDADTARVELPTDTFFQIVGPRPSLDMAGNGDRAGGVGRPSQKIVGLARVGPVGNNAVKEAAEPHGRIKSYGADFFDENAKLLGLVKLNELIDKAKQLFQSNPDLQKKLEKKFGAPLLREQLLYAAGEPVIKLLKEIDETAVRRIESTLKNVELVYPEAYRAAVNARGTIREAERAFAEYNAAKLEQKPDSERKLADRVAEVVAALLQLKSALEALSAAPLTQLAEAAQKLAADRPIELQALLRKLGWKGEVPPALAKVLSGLDVEILPVLVSEAFQARLAAIRTQLREAHTLALASILLAPLPPTLDELQQTILKAFKAEIDKRRAAIANAVGENAADFFKELDDTIEGVIAAEPPTTFKEGYLVAYEVLTSGKTSGIGKLRALIEKATPQPVEAACTAAAAAIDRIRRQILPLEVNSDGCLICGTAKQPETSNFCQPAQQALDQLKTLNFPEVAQFRQLTCDLAERFAALGASVKRLGSTPNVFCGPGGVQLWVQASSLRTKFGVGLAEWVASAVTVLKRIESQDWAPDAKTRLVALLAEAVSKAIDVVALAPESDQLRGITRLVQHTALRRIRNLLNELPALTIARFETAIAPLTADLKNLDEAAKASIDKEFETILVPLEKDVAAVASMLAALLPPWYAITRAGRDRLLADVPALEQKLKRSAQWNVSKDLYLGDSKDADTIAFQSELTLIAALQASEDKARVERLKELAKAIDELRGPAPARLVNQIRQRFGDRLQETAAAKVMELVDLRNEMNLLDVSLKKLLPTQRLLNYQYAVPLDDISVAGLIWFRPEKKDAAVPPALQIRSNTSINIASGSVTSAFSGETNPFFIDIGKGGEFLTLKFGAFSFGGGTGKSTSFKAPLQGVTIGEKMAFLAALAAFMGTQDSAKGDSNKPPTGPYVNRRALGPGILAGYRLGFPVFSIGAMGFANVFFDAHCELPFDAADSVVRLSLSTRQSPMTIFYGVYGGSAYFQIEGDRNGTRRVDISLEFGGASAIAYGPLSGIGRVMTGVMVSKEKGGSGTLSALFTADFTGHIACFGIAACFSLRMTQKSEGVSGVATLTYSFSCGPAKVTFRVSVVRGEKNVGGDKQAFLDLVPVRGAPVMVAQTAGTSATVAGGAVGSMRTMAVSPRHDWGAARPIYSLFPNAVGRRKRA